MKQLPVTKMDPSLLRRSFLKRSSIGSAALMSLLQDSSAGIIKPKESAKCKRVIVLCMAGGPSHLETFDYKPKLEELNGKPMPKSFTEGQQIAQLQGQANNLKVLGPQHQFAKYGKSGQEISEALPNIANKISDDICIIRSMQTEQINHDPAHTFMNTGSIISGRPSMGSWINYGLGSESGNLPGFVVLTSVGGGQSQPIAARQWHSGFLPSQHQGVRLRSKGDPVLYINNPKGVTPDRQKDVIDTIKNLNMIGNQTLKDPEIAARISQYEMAFRMQMSVPELVDFSDEPKHITDLYGTKGADGTFASNCLLARRLAERGVRFIQLYHRGWDHHGGIKKGIEHTAKLVDQASAALVLDLKERGLLEDTLVVWGGEFGRTPMAQGNGRDHHIKAFSMWMAGGGIKPGITYGATDELGYSAEKNIVNVHDFHATMLNLLGIDHEKFTYRYQGRDFRLTDVHGKILKDILI
ncbi:DUF1501 domain-containing protein [Verrucomicrobiales bacterium]|nr:DUF1501 domain-containing protein [Verrucomicrobiales bacterium]MDB4721038.1 DUF1501 domain-containing protein [Verrucomicrobiales bacterium]